MPHNWLSSVISFDNYIPIWKNKIIIPFKLSQFHSIDCSVKYECDNNGDDADLCISDRERTSWPRVGLHSH